MTELIRVNEAADRLGVSRSVIYKLLERNILTKHEIYGLTVINADELKKPEVANRKAGRPPKK